MQFRVEISPKISTIVGMSAAPLRFVIVDDNADTRFILARSVSKQFPQAEMQECWDAESALQQASAPAVSAVVVHRTTEMTGVYFVQELRKTSPSVPILMVSGIDRSHVALAAGASRFLLFEQWLQVGMVVSEMLASVSESA